MLDLKSNPIATARVPDLGPNQIAWLKANVPQFGPAKEAADRVKAHQAEVAAQMPAPQHGDARIVEAEKAAA